jgi:hypothetical protein
VAAGFSRKFKAQPEGSATGFVICSRQKLVVLKFEEYLLLL